MDGLFCTGDRRHVYVGSFGYMQQKVEKKIMKYNFILYIRYLIIYVNIFIILLSSSCSTQIKTIPVIKSEYILPPESLMKPCPVMTMITFHTNGELLIQYIEIITQYNICKSKMDSIINYIKQIQEKGASRSL